MKEIGTPVPKHTAAVAAGKAKRTTSSSSVVQYQVERQAGAGKITASVHVYSPLDEVYSSTPLCLYCYSRNFCVLFVTLPRIIASVS